MADYDKRREDGMTEDELEDGLFDGLFDGEELDEELDGELDDLELPKDIDLIEDDPHEEGGPEVRVGGLGGGTQTVKKVSMQTDVDVVFVIDCTGSMGPFLDEVKHRALNFHETVIEALGRKSRQVHKLRVKVIGFRDHYFDWEDPEHPPIEESGFFVLPDEAAGFEAFVNKLEPAGGEDIPESALEALYQAFRSDWNDDPEVSKKRQIIMLFTDAPAHPLDDPMRFDNDFNSHYPAGMPDSLQELQNAYHSADLFPSTVIRGERIVNSHRLILCVPIGGDQEEGDWDWRCMDGWECTTLQKILPDEGAKEISMEEIANLIGGSL